MTARDHTALPATHSRTIPAFTPQPQSITTLSMLYSLHLATQAELTWVAKCNEYNIQRVVMLCCWVVKVPGVEPRTRSPSTNRAGVE